MSSVEWVTISRAEQLTGYTEKAIRAKIAEGVWPEGVVWKRAPDGRVLISTKGYDAWAEGRVFELLAAPSKSTSPIADVAAANGSASSRRRAI